MSFYEKNMNDLIEEHLKKYQSHETKRAYRNDIQWLFDFMKIETPVELATISFANVVSLCFDYLDSQKKYKDEDKAPYNTRTVNRKAYSLRKFFDFLNHNYNYPKNPLYEYMPYAIEKKTTTNSLSERELLNIIHYVKEQYGKAKTNYSSLTKLQQYLIVCFLSLSLRRNEIATLKWSMLNQEEQYIKVLWKGWKNKYIPLFDSIYSLLVEFSEKKKENWYDSPYIFSPLKKWWYIDNQKKHINTNYIFSMVKRLCIKNDIDESRITPHSFRTTFVKKALQKGLEYIEIMNSTGHSSMELIKYYDTRDTLKANAINSMSDMFD